MGIGDCVFWVKWKNSLSLSISIFVIKLFVFNLTLLVVLFKLFIILFFSGEKVFVVGLVWYSVFISIFFLSFNKDSIWLFLFIHLCVLIFLSEFEFKIIFLQLFPINCSQNSLFWGFIV